MPLVGFADVDAHQRALAFKSFVFHGRLRSERVADAHAADHAITAHHAGANIERAPASHSPSLSIRTVSQLNVEKVVNAANKTRP